MVKLYHGTNVKEIKDGYLKPHQDHFLRQKMTFFTKSLPMAYAYTIKDPFTLAAFSYDSIHNVIFIYDRKRFLDHYYGGAIYEVHSDKNFKKFDDESGEYYCQKPVEVNEKNKIEVDLNDLLRNGVQLFFINPLPELDNDISQKYHVPKDFGYALKFYQLIASLHGVCFFKFLGDLVKLGVVIYEDGVRHIDPILDEKLELKTDDHNAESVDCEVANRNLIDLVKSTNYIDQEMKEQILNLQRPGKVIQVQESIS